MRLGIKPQVFLARLLAAFAVTYVLWIPIAPLYTQVLTVLTRVTLNATEAVSGQPRTIMLVRETAEGRPAIYYRHARFAQLESGIPAEWVQANLVLLIPLMLAVPAVSYGQRYKRLGLALLITILLQVGDVIVTVKAFYASFPPTGYGSLSRRLYQFGDAFVQAFDTQLFPFAVWAGIHFRQLLGRDSGGDTKETTATARQPQAKREKLSRGGAAKTKR